MASKIFHPLLFLIASASNNELARYVEFVKAENKILRARVSGQIHTKPDERSPLVKLGKALGHAIEELITLVAPSTFYRWQLTNWRPGSPSGIDPTHARRSEIR